MFLSIADIVIMALGVLLLLIWLWAYSGSKKYDPLFASLSEKEFPLNQLYGVGYFLLEKVGVTFKTRRDRKLRQELSVVFDEKYTEYYLRVVYSQQVTIALLAALAAFIMYGLSGELGILIILLVFSALAYYYFGAAVSKKISKRSEALMSEFSEVVSKLALLTNAGMIMREAWEETANAGSGVIYDEMRRSLDDMKNGVAEVEAIRLFGVRCILPEIKKFSATIIQGLTKGNSELSIMLREQSAEVWGERKQNVRRAGEKAASRLLLPIVIMFIGILIMIIVPIFTNLGT